MEEFTINDTKYEREQESETGLYTWWQKFAGKWSFLTYRMPEKWRPDGIFVCIPESPMEHE